MRVAEGLRVILSPVQLAAVLEGEHVTAHEITMNRLWGSVKILGASLELAGASTLLLAPDPTATKVGGLALGAHGSDLFATGLRQVWTGKSEKTLMEQTATATALSLGANETQAERAAMIVDVAVPLFAGAVAAAARAAEIRAGRIILIEHEAREGVQGGHSILKHIAQTEEQLQARLAVQGGIKTASSFESIRTAEGVLSQAVRLNATQIRTWAAAAKAGDVLEITYDAGKTIGYGVARASGKMELMQKVLMK